MIKLIRPERPGELTEEKKTQLTEKYKQTELSVWKVDFITQPLLSMSCGKCAFCECRLMEEGKYMNVEHYYPKSIYPEEVVEWKNLLPVCNRCNIKKSNHDTKKYPVLNPADIEPKEHLLYNLNEFRIVGNDQLGELTEAVLDLNDLRGLSMTRFAIWQELVNQLKELESILNEYDPNSSTPLKRIKVQKKYKQIMCSGIPEVEYSATAATLINAYPKYPHLKGLIMKKELWDEEMTLLEEKVFSIAFKLDNFSKSTTTTV